MKKPCHNFTISSVTINEIGTKLLAKAKTIKWVNRDGLNELT